MERLVPFKLTGLHVNKSRFIKPEKKWLLICDVICLFGCLVSIFNIEWFYLERFFLLGLFFYLGYLHNKFLHGKLPILGFVAIQRKLKYTVKATFQILFISVICFLSIYPSLWRFALINALTFILPFIISLCWYAMLKIPDKKFKVWFNKEESIDKKVSIYLNSIPVQIRITSKYFDISYRSFYLNLPCQTKWGKLFDKFLAEVISKSDESLEIKDETGEFYGWQFTAEKTGSGRKKFVDPELDLRQNKLHDNMIITAIRVKRFERILEYN